MLDDFREDVYFSYLTGKVEHYCAVSLEGVLSKTSSYLGA